ncbi:hypothetical protein McanCB56680_002437, partial [Microsporum canis]
AGLAKMASSPSAQATTDRNRLTTLPVETYLSILSYLPNSDIKNLRLTCSSLSNIAYLRLKRVFLSVNRRDIDVFRAIASHETLCQKVVEIIWDDTQFISWKLEEVVREDGYLVGAVTGAVYDGSTDRGGTVKRCPKWFTRGCVDNIHELGCCTYDEVEDAELIKRRAQVSALIPPWDSWTHYQRLTQEQEEVIRSRADVDALKFGLDRFPALKRVTLIPSAHKQLFTPLYDTPMIRSLPYTFNYPMPCIWTGLDESGIPDHAVPWNDSTSDTKKNRWRGFRAVTRALAEQMGKHHVSELVIDTTGLNTGVNYHIFNTPCRESFDLDTLLRQPGFRHLDLNLFVGWEKDDVWLPFRHCLLHSCLSQCSDLEYISFRTNRGIYATDDLSMDHFIPLQSIFPVEKWPRLKHFALSSFPVVQSDLLALLAGLPPTLRSVELSQLLFIDEEECYTSLLEQMRNTLHWGDRPEEERPRVSFWPRQPSGMPHIYAWMENSVENFLYGGGENPMHRGPGRRMYFSG